MKYTGNEINLLSKSQVKEITEKYQKNENVLKKHGINYVKSEFFGINALKEIVDGCGCDVAGFRAYYGLTDEDYDNDGRKKPTPNLVLIPVDFMGNDLTFKSALGGMKDDPDENSGAGGLKCPKNC